MYRKLTKRLYYAGLNALSADKLQIRRLKQLNKLVVLNLHRVSPIENSFWPPLHPEIFEELLIFLRKNFAVCRFDEVALAGDGKASAIISFDDGYYDFIEYALPLLDKYEMPANMNIIPQCAISGRPIWNVQFYDFLQQAPTSLVKEIRFPGLDLKFDGNSKASRLRFGLRLSRFLKNRPRSEREDVWQSIKQVLGKISFESTRMMTTSEIKQITDRTEVGVHSFSHESMGFEDNEFFKEDFGKCRAYFSEELGLPMTIYAFPNGSYRPEQVEFLRYNGIKSILLVDEKFAEPQGNIFPRLTIYGDSSSEIRMRSVGL